MPLRVNMLWCLRISPVIDLHGDYGKRAGEGGQGGVAEADRILRWR